MVIIISNYWLFGAVPPPVKNFILSTVKTNWLLLQLTAIGLANKLYQTHRTISHKTQACVIIIDRQISIMPAH